MDRELLDHAARVLQHTPAHILDAGALYDRVRQETGIDCGISLFLVRLQAASHRFVVLPGTADLDPLGAWSEVERIAYSSGLATAGLSRWPLVTLCAAGEAEASGATGTGCAADPAPGATIDPAAAADSLGDVHRSVADLLRSGAADPLLRDAVGAAVAALEAALSRGSAGVRRSLRRPRAGGGGARSTTPPRRPPPPR